jgi:hypothetical protein
LTDLTGRAILLELLDICGRIIVGQSWTYNRKEEGGEEEELEEGHRGIIVLDAWSYWMLGRIGYLIFACGMLQGESVKAIRI